MKLSTKELEEIEKECRGLKPEWLDHVLEVKTMPEEKLKRYNELTAILQSEEYMTEEQKNSIFRKNDYR